MRRPLLGLAVITAVSASLTLSVAPVSNASPDTNFSSMSDIAHCVMGTLAPAGGTHGVYLQRTGGPVLATSHGGFEYEPASSIKPLIALYALTKVKDGAARLSEQVPKINESGGPEDCPPSTFSGTEPLGTALQQIRGSWAGSGVGVPVGVGCGPGRGAGQAARAGGPHASVHRFSQDCSRWRPSGR
jgi:hypothetical protein